MTIKIENYIAKKYMQGKIKLVTRRHQSTETAQAVTEMIKLADKAIK